MLPKTWFAVIVSALVAGSAPVQAQTNSMAAAPQAAALKVTSTAFQDGGRIPIPYTCSGLNLSPPLAWTGAPARTETFALICDDPDAGYKTFTHWVVYNIPKTAASLPEKVPTNLQLQNGTLQGYNDFKKIGYRGPCPPTGTHRYYFKVYALDNTLLLLGDIDRAKLEEAMKGHILAQGQLMGTFKR